MPLAPGDGAEQDPVPDHRFRGGGERGKDCARPHRPIGTDRLQRWLPRAHHDDPGADRKGAALQGGLRSFPGRDLSRTVSDRSCMALPPSSRWRRCRTSSSVDVEPSRVAAIIIEPVQGEGGFYVAPFDFLQQAACGVRRARHSADRRRGAGRCRTYRASSLPSSTAASSPDLITLAKSIAGGIPISAVVGRADVMDSVGPGGLGGTYAGSPLGCAAALAVLDVFEEEGILQRSLELGEHMVKRLAAMADAYKPYR